MSVPAPDDDAVAAFWADARIRAKLNRLEAYTGPGVTDSVPPPAWAFGDSAAQADELLALVLEGRKSATSSALRDYAAEDEPLPTRGSLSILLDGAGRPRALVHITDVRTARFGDVDEEHARAEGEGDLSLAHWRQVHREFFTRSAGGQPVDDDTEVVLERFEVLVPTPRRRPLP